MPREVKYLLKFTSLMSGRTREQVGFNDSQVRALYAASNCPSSSFPTTCHITRYHHLAQVQLKWHLLGTMKERIQHNPCIHFSWGWDTGTQGVGEECSQGRQASLQFHISSCAVGFCTNWSSRIFPSNSDLPTLSLGPPCILSQQLSQHLQHLLLF